MSNPNLTGLVFLLDRSGSMQSIKTDVVGGFDAFIAEQRTAEGRCAVTLTQFDHKYEVVYSGVPIEDVPSLNLQPRGRTALLDSMGTLITDTAAQIDALDEADRPGTVIVAIMTDGHENASSEWRRPDIKALVEQQTNAHGWEFLYLGADQDAVEIGRGLGVKDGQSLTYAKDRSREAMAAAAGNIRAYRNAKLRHADAVMAGFTDAQRAEVAVDITVTTGPQSLPRRQR
ncbi:vWA domain-containing protein [Mycolicibacter kumamotonensis]|uniref:VWA domain-containing protein n=1 Tax=Mycolicibacter kumamotonensis TaxID=354243 RepID=A0A7K3LHL1_9MYCO|nr:vWA domain-containing protein [Mycolicibacter kumamotonensis]NDJ91792.1 VWA domain-containing protein [Mycolicibacter kumamotonensis]